MNLSPSPVIDGGAAVAEPTTSEFYTMARRADHIVAWSDLEPTIETGDVVLFSGQSVTSKFIQMGQGGTDWSHIGMFVRTSSPDDPVLLFESTTYDGVREVLGGERRGGVRLVNAEECLRHYLQVDDTVKVITRQYFVDQQMIDRGIVDPASRMDALAAFIRRVSGLPYERNPYELVRAMHRGLEIVTKKRTADSYFCSELVAECYMILGLLPHPTLSKNNRIQQQIIENQLRGPSSGVPKALDTLLPHMQRGPSAYTPLDFSSEGKYLPFLRDVKRGRKMVGLGPHIDITFTDKDPPEYAPDNMDAPVHPRARVAIKTAL